MHLMGDGLRVEQQEKDKRRTRAKRGWTKRCRGWGGFEIREQERTSAFSAGRNRAQSNGEWKKGRSKRARTRRRPDHSNQSERAKSENDDVREEGQARLECGGEAGPEKTDRRGSTFNTRGKQSREEGPQSVSA